MAKYGEKEGEVKEIKKSCKLAIPQTLAKVFIVYSTFNVCPSHIELSASAHITMLLHLSPTRKKIAMLAVWQALAAVAITEYLLPFPS